MRPGSCCRSSLDRGRSCSLHSLTTRRSRRMAGAAEQSVEPWIVVWPRTIDSDGEKTAQKIASVLPIGWRWAAELPWLAPPYPVDGAPPPWSACDRPIPVGVSCSTVALKGPDAAPGGGGEETKPASSDMTTPASFLRAGGPQGNLLVQHHSYNLDVKGAARKPHRLLCRCGNANLACFSGMARMFAACAHPARSIRVGAPSNNARIVFNAPTERPGCNRSGLIEFRCFFQRALSAAWAKISSSVKMRAPLLGSQAALIMALATTAAGISRYFRAMPSALTAPSTTALIFSPARAF